MSQYKTIGILGGMGPEATAELYREIIRIFQREYGAIYDQDYPEMIILNLPIPDVVERAEEQDKVEQLLLEGVKKLRSAGAQFIAIPCNTVTNLIDKRKEEASIPIINIIQETAKEVEKSRIKKVGLLGTEMTIKEGFYKKSLQNTRLIIPTTKDQRMITRIIMNILSGQKSDEDKKLLVSLIKNQKEQGAEKVILGCTELPLLLKRDDVIDTIEILARAAVRESTAKFKNYINQNQQGG